MFEDEVAVVQDEITALKSRADLLGVKYHPSISLDKLRDKVNTFMTKEVAPEEPVVAPEATDAVPETETAYKRRLRAEASKLVRIRVTCMNPAKKEWDGEIFSVGNGVIGTFTKFVPFNADEGWHVPHVIYEQLVERQCQVFTTTKDSRGNSSRRGKLIKEFAIEVLPPLTQAELHDLAQRQAMAKSID